MQPRSAAARWDLLEAAAWIAKRTDSAVDAAHFADFDPSALQELGEALQAGKLSASGQMERNGTVCEISAPTWRKYRVIAVVETIVGCSFLGGEDFFADVISHEAYPDSNMSNFYTRRSDMRGYSYRIIKNVDVASADVREIWQPPGPVPARRGRPRKYPWPEVKLRLKARRDTGERAPVDQSDLIYLIDQILQEIGGSDGVPDSATTRAAIKKYDLDLAAGMTRGN